MTAQNLIEVWTVATRPAGENGLGYSPARAAVEIDKLLNLFRFLPDIPQIFPIWADLVVRHGVMGKPSHDARLVAVMQAYRIPAVLTFDRSGFGRFPGIEVVDPRSVG